MTTMVEDLLLLARLDSGRPLAAEPVDLTRLVIDAVSDAQAAGADHRWQLDLPDEPVTVTGDAPSLHQVLANLLANARTHTPPGTTVITSVASSQPGTVVVTVLDDGPGIPPDAAAHRVRPLRPREPSRAPAPRRARPAPGSGCRSSPPSSRPTTAPCTSPATPARPRSSCACRPSPPKLEPHPVLASVRAPATHPEEASTPRGLRRAHPPVELARPVRDRAGPPSWSPR